MTNEFSNLLKQDKIPVLEEFYTIQGEGFNSGKAAYFVRLGGCDLACRWCDSKESWVPRLDQFVKINDIIDRVRQTTADTIVVTGGEPLIYNFNRFTELSRQAGITTMIETSGAHEFSGVWVPALTTSDTNNEGRVSSYYIENGSYMKLRTIQLGYNVPKGF
ncbi:MAG: 4Fe-4S cluster-binding domain-containing protein, partial [Bacteroidales bacterium]|nr:4Fe-4S cluster-binding domain-containing protein [Bacteroidales bacterium]